MEIIDGKSELGRQLKQLDELAKDIRGSILEQAIWIERLIENIIAWHFCPEEDKRYQFFSLVINGTDITFSSKIKILKKLLELYYPDLSQKYPKVTKELNKVRDFRNKIAHAMLDNSLEFLAHRYTDRVQLDVYQDGKEKKLVVTIMDRDEKLKECSRIALALDDIQKEVTKRTLANVV